MVIVGISAFYHDSAVAIIRDGKILAAAQEERFSRKKGDANFPSNALKYCLDASGLTLNDVDYIGFYDKPLLTFDRLLETYLAFAPVGFKSFVTALPLWVKQKLLIKKTLLKELNILNYGVVLPRKVVFGYHHYAHAASAFFPSPFQSAAVLIMDGVGEWATTSLGIGKNNKIELLCEMRFPHSIGMLYSAFTYYLGFKVNEGEYKVMGLAPYGSPIYMNKIHEHLLDLKDDGSFRLNMKYFNYCSGLTMTNHHFDQLFNGIPPRKSGEPLTKTHMDIASSIQVVIEEIILKTCQTLYEKTGEANLCLAGGVALNCVANGRIIKESPFKNIWIQPAAGDAGGALGIALGVYYANEYKRVICDDKDSMEGAYLGPHFSDDEIQRALDKYRAIYHKLSDEELYNKVADLLIQGGIIGWFQGRMEFGPRALGNRSIIADPRVAKAHRTLNLKIKYRESFRPFAPAVLREDVARYFELETDSPYMLLVSHICSERRPLLSREDEKREGFDRLNNVYSDIPATTHVDYSARVQTVHANTNPRFYQLLKAFKTKTGCSVLINTSFNIRDEPIVCTPDDAYRCFMGTEIDVLILENFILYKREQG